MTSGSPTISAAISRATRAVCSRVVPSGMSMMTWNSLLLSKGSIFTFTKPMPTSAMLPSSRAAMMPRKSPLVQPALEEPAHVAPVDAGHPSLLASWSATAGTALRACALEEPDGGPRGDDEGDEQREDHRGAGADRDRAHVGAHQAADEGHRQDRGDDRPGGEDGRVADLADGSDGDLAARVCRGLSGRR